MKDDDLCPMSDLPPDQCALPCHRNEHLPAGAQPEPRRGVDPTGFATSLTPPASEQHEPRDTRPRPVKPKRPKTACRWVNNEWVTREHLHACTDRACAGCKPCGDDHCALFGCPQHVDSDAGVVTCPSCIGEFRDNVAEVEALTALVVAELAYATTVEAPSNDPLAPIWTFTDITDVATMAGPYAPPAKVDERGWCEWPRILHPVETLDRIEHDLRTEYEQGPADGGPVVSRVCAYLDRMCQGRFPHDEAFEKTFRDVKALRVQLENVLSDSRAPETGAPCPTCAADTNRVGKPPRLVKRHAHWCDDPKCTRLHTSTIVDDDGIERPDTSKDEWVCPAVPEHRWSPVDYEKFVAGAYLAHADRLTASQIRQQYGIPTGTIRDWASTRRRVIDGETVEVAPKLRPAGKTQRGVLLYKVADVLALRAREARQKEAQDA